LTRHRRALAELLWREWSPGWNFSADDFARTAPAFDNPDWAETVIHNYRYRLGAAPGDPGYARLADRLAALPPIAATTITLDGAAHGVLAATDGREWAGRFTGRWRHRTVAGAGHNVAQEQPAAFAAAVLAVVAGELGDVQRER
jgi:pimeloyl-ACP methyl ester carboxylesterase